MPVQVRGSEIGQKFTLGEKLPFYLENFFKNKKYSEVLHGFFNSEILSPHMICLHKDLFVTANSLIYAWHKHININYSISF